MNYNTKEVRELLIEIRDAAKDKAKPIWGEEARFIAIEDLEHLINAALLGLIIQKEEKEQ